MYVWYHLSTILKRCLALRIAGLGTLCVAFITALLFANVSSAATGVNQTLSFSGRLTNSSGGSVPDGYYNIQFKIYQDGAGTSAGNSGGTLKWTESYINNGGTSGVQVKNGYFSVSLGSKTAFGSSVDWNQDTLWLSMNVAGSSTSCTTFGTAPCTADGEMLPMKRLTSTPFALNSAMLGGKTADGFIQNGTSAQTGDFNISGTGIANTLQGNTSVIAPLFDRASSGTLSIGTTNATSITIGQSGVTTSIAGVLGTNTLDATSATTLQIGTTNATSIKLAQDVTVAAGKSLTITGGNTASRPASPTEGMLYFDTTTKQLLVYANGKWQADRSTASKIVATSASGGTSSAVASGNVDSADYVNTSTTSAQTTINSALSSLGSNGGSVYLQEGTYIIDGSISIPNNVTLIGAGSGTIIKLKNSINANINAIVATDTTTGTGVKVSNLRIDGNKSNNSSGTQTGIYFNNMGGGNGASARQGTKLTDLWISNLRSFGIELENSNNGIVANNHTNNSSMGMYFKNDLYMTVTGNISQGNTTRGIYASPINQSTITGNTIESNSNYGILIDGTSSGNTISGNMINNNAFGGLSLATATDNAISGNRLRNNGGSTTNEAIILGSTSTSNSITGNTITDSSATTNNYAIDVQDSASTGNQFSNNSLGGGSISDAATTNIYANQLDASGTLINKSAAGAGIQTTTNTADAFTVQNAAGTSALSVNTSTNAVLVAGSLDTTTAAGMTIGSANATSITIGKSSSNIATTVLGTAVFKPTTGNDSTTSFQLQRADGTKMLVADSSGQTITFGSTASGNYTVVSTSTGAITKYGNARDVKTITLTPEFSGAVLDAQSDSACVSASNGTMTAGLDSVGRTNYYNWTSTQGTNQCYDVVVQIPVPAGFNGWQSNSIMMKTSNTGNSTYGISIIDSTGSADANYSSYATPGTLSTSWSNVATSSLSGTYTAGDYFTVKIRMSAKNNANLQLGNITLNYYSNK